MVNCCYGVQWNKAYLYLKNINWHSSSVWQAYSLSSPGIIALQIADQWNNKKYKLNTFKKL